MSTYRGSSRVVSQHGPPVVFVPPRGDKDVATAIQDYLDVLKERQKREKLMDTELVKYVPPQGDLEKLIIEYADANTPEEKAMFQVLTEMMDGKKFVSPTAMVNKAYKMMDGRVPGFGFAPATADVLEFRADRGRVSRFDPDKDLMVSVRYQVGDWQYQLDEEIYTFPRAGTRNGDYRVGKEHKFIARTQMPIIPPRVKYAHDLEDKFIAFEVKEWQIIKDETQMEYDPPPRPHYDPLLLEHIAGDLFRVVDQWELTDLEIAILVGLERGQDVVVK